MNISEFSIIVLSAVLLGGLLSFGSVYFYISAQMKATKQEAIQQIRLIESKPALVKEQTNYQRAVADRENLGYQHDENMAKLQP